MVESGAVVTMVRLLGGHATHVPDHSALRNAQDGCGRLRGESARKRDRATKRRAATELYQSEQRTPLRHPGYEMLGQVGLVQGHRYGLELVLKMRLKQFLMFLF